MNSLPSIALSGLSAATLRLDAAAHNIANGMTPGFRAQRVVQSADAGGGVSASVVQAGEPGTDLAKDLVDQMAATYSFAANLRVILAQRAMTGTLLDTRA